MKKSTYLYKKFILLLTLLLLIGGFCVDVWGASPVEFNSTKGMFLNSGVDNSFNNSGVTISDSESKKFSIVQDSVEFRLLNWDNYDKKNADGTHFYIFANSSKTIHWYPNDRFSVSVSKIEVYGQNGTWKTGGFLGIGQTTHTGTAYFRKNNSASNVDSYSKSSWDTKTVNFSPAFGSEDYITIKTQEEQGGSTGEYRVQWLKIYYSVTPPAPTLKGAGTVTRSQFVEGRSNNTLTLTDYFKPFNSGVSMSYVVKKKNGSGVYETINSGYDITSNVFKTTVVGEYQIFANSNATGAFSASASSPALDVTIEEVRPVTISVGTNELYVDGTTSMTITEQLNTTNDVVFEYDEDFFDYNESTHVLTAKNDGNASFSTTSKSIRVTQESDGVFAAVDMSINFTIKKYDNAISCSWDGWSKTANFDEEIPVTFSSNNDTGTSIDVTPATGTTNATYEGTNNKVVASHNIGSATWTVSQAEDYKYKAAVNQTLTVNVDALPSPGCRVLVEKDQHAVGFYDNSGGLEYSLSCKGDMLYFKAGKYSDVATGELNVYGYNTSGTELFHETYGVGSLTTSGVDEEIDISSKEVVKIKFKAGNTISKWFSDVYVSRKVWLTLENEGGTEISEIDMPINTVGGNVTRNTFYIDYSTCASKIKLVSNNSRVKFAANNSTTYEFDEDNGTRKAIELTYTSGVSAEEIAATITVYTPYEHKTLTVNAETKGKLSTTIEYKGADSYAVDHANMNATDLFQVRDENDELVASPTIKLISSDSTKIDIVHVDGKDYIDFLCGGSATITASYAGDANYLAANNLGQSITVNKLSDAINWSGVGDDGKIHVLADTDIPTSIASANTDIASYSVASANPYLSVTQEEGVYTLHAGIVGEVDLTATSAGNCMYARASGSKTIAVDPREHAIIWNQDLEGIQTDDRGYITNHRITLNAYAVDNGSNPTNVPVSYEITGGGTFATIENGNELVINVANLSGTLSTTITATTTVGTKYAIVSETKTISVVRWGTNTAKSADNTSDIKDGKIVIEAPHATFTFSGATAITEFGYATVGGKPEGYKLAQALDNGDGSKTYNFSWVSTNANCSIQVNKISFWIKAYDSDAFIWQKAKVSFDGADEVSVGTAAMTANDRDFAHFSKPENYTNRNVPVVCRVTGYENFDFYIKNIAIEYTVYTTAPSATSGIEEVDRTINAESDKKTVDVRDLFSYAVAPPSDFEYSYEIVGAPEHAHLLADGYTFWADAVGDYTVRAKVNMDEDHRESEWSDEKTIRVNKVPYVFDNTAADEKWETETNWNIGGWPIENLPTEDDDVIVRGHLIVDEEIPVHSLTIGDGVGHIVEIAPEGGLTIGAGGIIGATKDNLKLKAQREGETKGKTGYLRIHPSCERPMPAATVELYSTAYYDMSVTNYNEMGKWQFVGYPMEGGAAAKTVFSSSFLYSWSTEKSDWVNKRKTCVLQPFEGYATSQYMNKAGLLITFTGNLVANTNKTIELAYNEGDEFTHNMIANSYSAPIDITKFEDTDFSNMQSAVYIFNTGSLDDINKLAELRSGSSNIPGQYLSIPIGSAAAMKGAFETPTVIAAMQGFCVHATGDGASLTLDYNKLVYNAESKNTALHVVAREPERINALCVSLYSEGVADNLYLLESDQYDAAFENGYDAKKMMSGEGNIFAIEDNEHLAVDATNSLIGTRVGVRTGEATAYVMTFTHLQSDDYLALLDNETQETIEISEGMEYSFYAVPNTDITERFQIVESSNAPAITTGTDEISAESKVHKFIQNGQLFILKNGVLYDTMGKVVR